MDRPSSKPPVQHEISGDALDRLLDALGAVTASVDDLRVKVEEAARDGLITAESMRETRKDIGALSAKIERLGTRVGTAERNIRRHDAGFRSHSDVDAKHESELAALVIAIDETRKLAKKTATALEEMKRDQKTAAEEQTTTIVTKVDEAEKDQQKGRLSANVAAAINLAVGVVYLLLKLLESRGH